jgi:hypothetical protein
MLRIRVPRRSNGYDGWRKLANPLVGLLGHLHLAAVSATQATEDSRYWKMYEPTAAELRSAKLAQAEQNRLPVSGSSSSHSQFSHGNTTEASSSTLTHDPVSSVAQVYASQLAELHEMGFHDDDVLIEALRQHGGQVSLAVNELF